MGSASLRRVVFRLPLQVDSDVAQARVRLRELCTEYHFSSIAVEGLAIAASEVARNVLTYAGDGEMLLGTQHDGARLGIVVIARDDGPGISNVEAAMRDGFSTGHGLGLGLPSAQRLVHEFDICSTIGRGTTVTLIVWAR
jgi:serine/threonine-protein kinase RsbT